MESSKVIVTRERRRRIEMPFTLKVGQVFTGFGIGCGIGIGVGRPLNLGVIEALGVAMASLGTNVPSSMSTRPARKRKSGRGAIPVLNQVMGATRGATDAFSGVGRHVNNSLRKLGAKNIEAGIGCGVGFGHGFGVGLAVKPGVVKQIQSSLVQALTMMMVKFGIAPNLSLDQGLIPASLQSSIMPSNQNPVGSIMQLATKVPDRTSQSFPTGGNLSAGSYETSASKKSSLNPSHGSRTEEVIGSFLQNPLLKDEGSELNELDGRLRSENNMLHMVLKHQQVIEDLMKENEKLRQILVEDLNIPPSKLQASFPSSTLPCTDCFECRRKQRRK